MSKIAVFRKIKKKHQKIQMDQTKHYETTEIPMHVFGEIFLLQVYYFIYPIQQGSGLSVPLVRCK